MRAITARGSSREIGRALGEEARQAVRERVFESQAYADLLPWRSSERLAAIMAASREACPAYLGEIAGIAEGVGVALEDVFLWNCRGDLPPPGSETEGCTTVMMPPDGGRPARIAHNEDGGADLAGSGFMARVEPEAGPAFDSFCYPGMLPGHSFAMNDAGLVQTINNISPHDLNTGIARHVVCRAILACRSIEQALVWLKRADRASGFHHNLGSATEDQLISVEAPASGCAARSVTVPRCHANHLIFSEFAELSQTVSPSTAARQARAEALLQETEDPLDILFDRDDEALPVLCRGEAENGQSYTLATVLCRLTSAGTSMEVFHGPSRVPVFTATNEPVLAS